jgi:acetylornithine deacetylase/succinyl-diaminopimelate desuccinylase-like protein
MRPMLGAGTDPSQDVTLGSSDSLTQTHLKREYPALLNLRTLAITATLTCSAHSALAATPEELNFRGIYKELIEINTSLSSGSCTEAANAMAARLRTAGMSDSDIHVIVPPEWPKQGNLVATLHGELDDDEAVMLLAHIDVVEAKRADWERDPFTLIEEDGYFFGRGTVDDKAMAAIFVDVMMGLSRTKQPLHRGVKLALTCGEETPNIFNGASYLLENHRELMNAKFALNEGGGGRLDDQQQPIFNGIQAGEKVYQDFWLEVTNPGGHSSRPRPDNAINRLATALGKVATHNFPIEFNGTTRAFFARRAQMETGQLASDMLAILDTPPNPEALARITQNPGYNSVLHTTCVTTMLDAGHAPNALPQRAGANVNCRIFPGHSQESIRQTLEKIVNDEQVMVTFVDPPEKTSPPPSLTPEILEPIERLTQQMWPGIPVIPAMVAGGTDGRFLTPAGIPTYGVSGLFTEPGKVNAHGLNERVLVKSLYKSREFLDQLVKIYVTEH